MSRIQTKGFLFWDDIVKNENQEISSCLLHLYQNNVIDHQTQTTGDSRKKKESWPLFYYSNDTGIGRFKVP